MRLAATILAFAAWGCNDSTVAVGNDNPLGTVGGIVFDTATEMPLAGATIKVIAAGVTLQGSSAMDGTFVVPKVPSGGFEIEIGNMGFETALFQGVLAGAIGNFPVHNPTANVGVIGLIKNDGQFPVRIVDENGAPVPNVKIVARAQVRWVDFSNGQPFSRGSYAVTAASDAQGVANISALPEYGLYQGLVNDELDIDVPPVQVMGAGGVYSFLGLTVKYLANHLGNAGISGQTPTITLAGPHTALTVVDSNVSYIRIGGAGYFDQGIQVPPAGPITVEFNQALNSATVRVQLLSEDGVTPASVQATPTVTANLLSIAPASALVAGARYNILIHAQSYTAQFATEVQSEVNLIAPFFVQQATGVTPAVNPSSVMKTTDPAGNVIVTFTLNEPIGLGQSFTGITPISCVAFYEGANLDNGDPASYPGEFENGGTMLLCPNQGSPPPSLDITAIHPIEQTPPSLITGFASKWSITINNSPPPGVNPGGCRPGIPIGACSGPQIGNKIHLAFSKLPVAQTIRRTNGQPVVDDATKLVLTIP